MRTAEKLWIDDIRPAPDGWDHAYTAEQALYLIRYKAEQGERYNTISFDHDLGGEFLTARPVVRYLADESENGKYMWPDVCHVHSQNPVGIEWLTGMINRYGPGVTK